MLTDTEARDLLHQAADTIEVLPAAPFVEPPRDNRRPLVVLTAAAAVLAIAVGALVWRADRTAPVGRPHGQVTIPSVVGYPTRAALEVLKTAGLSPRVQQKPSCQDSGRALRTKPFAGTTIPDGSAVVLVAASSETMRCAFSPVNAARDEAWQLVDLARGVGSPRFADLVQLSVDDQAPVTVSASEAHDPDTWPTCDARHCDSSALDAIKAQLALGTRWPIFLAAQPLPQPWPAAFADARSANWFYLDYPKDGLFPLPWAIEEFFAADGTVIGVHLDTDPGLGQPRETGEGSGVGQRFVDFALGRSDTLPVDTPVRLYLGNVYRRTLTAEQALDPRAWRTCVLYAASGCPPSALRTIARYLHSSGEPVRVGDPSTPASPCLARSGPTPTDTGGTRRVVLTPSGNTDCLTGFWIEVWVNDVGQIVAVNELLAEP